MKTFRELYVQADQTKEPISVVAAGGADQTVLEALSQAASRGWVKPILTGDQREIETLAASLAIDLNGFEIIDTPEPAITAVQAVVEKRARLLMKGQIPTPALLKAVLNDEEGLTTGRVICQMVLMEIPRDNRVFLMTDTGICIQPKLSQKADLVMHAIETCDALGVCEPRIALMAASEKINEKMPETIDAEKLVAQAARGDFGACRVQGPLSFDLAYAADAGSKKNIEGDVVGSADAMVFPDLLSANLTVKGIMYTADCHFGGVLCGTSAPVVFMSRADRTPTRLNSLAFAIAMLNHE